MTDNEKKLLLLLAGMTFVSGVAVAHSLSVHIKERQKRKQLNAAVNALQALKDSDIWSKSTPKQREALIETFTQEHLYPKK